ncbi:hypothetical protein K438DRAFT_1630060 [Mycena galopus ATCC 62051]|nr:hypothetical protein K438DRAFT_1630060 [Mycena galopus ATCC 62051]
MTSASYASLTGLAVLKNPRKTLTKGLVFDAHFYLGSETQESIMGLLRYFNANDTHFASVRVYLVYTTAAKMELDSDINLFLPPGSEVTRKDYSVVGDIQWLFPLGLPDDVDVDMRRRPYVHIAGAVMDPKEPTVTWSMEADQYTSSFRELQKAAQGLTRSFFPAFCTIKDSQCYSNNKKPVPYNKCYLMVAGYLTDFKSTMDNTGKVKDFFGIDVENVAFLGSQVTPATGGTVPDSPGMYLSSLALSLFACLMSY